MEATFSVVIPVYNRAHLVRQTIDSVLAQDHAASEIIAVDDGSTDDSLEVLQSYGNVIRVFTQENQGQAAARNHAMRRATSQYIVFLDSDDVLFPWALSVYAKAAEATGGPAMMLSPRQYFRDVGELDFDKGVEPRFAAHADYFASQSGQPDLVGAGTIAVRRENALAHGGFTEVRCNSEDLDFMLKMGSEAGCTKVLEPVMVGVRLHDSKATGDLGSTLKGLDFLLDQEASGTYPGGRERRNERLNILGFQVRCVSAAQARRGSWSAGVRLYLQAINTHLRLRRFRYLLGFPLVAAKAAGLRLLKSITGSSG